MDIEDDNVFSSMVNSHSDENQKALIIKKQREIGRKIRENNETKFKRKLAITLVSVAAFTGVTIGIVDTFFFENPKIPEYGQFRYECYIDECQELGLPINEESYKIFVKNNSDKLKIYYDDAIEDKKIPSVTDYISEVSKEEGRGR